MASFIVVSPLPALDHSAIQSSIFMLRNYNTVHELNAIFQINLFKSNF
jgi:hypothetical protein